MEANHSGHDHTSSTHSDGGIHLISWRWDEYATIVYITLSLLVACVLKIGFYHSRILRKHFPESCVLIVFGIIVGCIVRFGLKDDVKAFPNFTSSLFFNVLLPPIVLHASYAMYDEDFFDNLDTILIFAVVGTIVNVFAFSSLLFVVHVMGWLNLAHELSFVECMIFASIVSAVDPVAVLAIFEEIRVNSVLYFLVFGESLLNDGVTIVLYNAMTTLNRSGESADPVQYVLAVVSLFTVVFGGMFVGLLMGIVTSLLLLLTNHAHIRVLEPLIIATTAYFSYVLAEVLHWSGIMSLITCGIMQKRYAFLNASKKTYTTVKYMVMTLASISDCIIFIFLGKVSASKFFELEFHPEFLLWTLAFCILVRFLGVFVLTYFANLRRKKPISAKEQFIMAYGGLRGAVGFSLAYILDDDEPMKRIFLTTTLSVIFFTVFIQGGTIKVLVNWLKISKKASKDKHIICDVNKKTCDYITTGIESILGNISISSYFHMMQVFDQKYVKRLLVRKGVQDRITMRLEKITLDEHYARLYGPSVLAMQTKIGSPERQVDLDRAERAQQVSSETESGLVDEAMGEEIALREKRCQRPPASMMSREMCRRSLHRAFLANPYDHFRTLKRSPHDNGNMDDDDEGHDDDEDFQAPVMKRLNYRRRQTRDIEHRLMRADTIDNDDDDDDDDAAVTDNVSQEEVPPGDAFPLVFLRKRSNTTGMSARDIRRQYKMTKQRFKSFHE